MRIKKLSAFEGEDLQKEMAQATAEAPARRAAQGLAPYPEQTNQFNPNSAASIEAAIWDGSDGKARDEMYAGMDTLYDDPTSPYYNQYRKPTNTQYTDPLKKYGLEVPDIITADWINEQWSQYGKYLPTNAAGTSASLPKKHTKEQEIAFSLYQLNAIEYTTQKAEKELADIRDKVTWYAQHGYSQDYIAKVIGSEKHSTLDSLNITRDPNAISQFDDDGYNISTKQGTAVQLNRSVYFDNDILTGMYWKALNGADDVDDFTAAVYAYQNKGKLTGGTPRQQKEHTYGTKEYQPYNAGCTDVDVKMAFGQDEFTYDDYKRLMAEAQAEQDDTKIKLLKRVYNAEDDTAEAEKEYATLRGVIRGIDYANTEIPEGKTVQQYFQELADGWMKLDSYKTLNKMDKGREAGVPINLNRSVNYRKEDVVDELVARYNAAHGGSTMNYDSRVFELKPAEGETSNADTSSEEESTEGSAGVTSAWARRRNGGASAPADTPDMPAEETAATTGEEEQVGTATKEDKRVLSFLSGETDMDPRTQEQYERWQNTHQNTYTFKNEYLMELDPRIPTARGGAARAAGGAMSDAGTGGKTLEKTFQLPTGGTVTESELGDIMKRIYAGDTASLTEDEVLAGRALMSAIPWLNSHHNVEGGSEVGKIVGNVLQAFGMNPLKDFSDATDATMTAYLGEDARNVLGAMEDPYATTTEKADLAMQFYNASSAASKEHMELGAYLEQHPEVLGDLQKTAGIIRDRHAQADADTAEAAKLDQQRRIAESVDLLQRANDPNAEMTEEERARAESLTLSPDEVNTYLDAANRPEWNDAKSRLLSYYSDTMADAFDIDDGMGEATAAAKLKLYGDANIDAWTMDEEKEAILQQAQYLYAQDAKIAASAGMTLGQYYDTVYGEGNRPSVDDMLHAAVRLRQAQNDPANLNDEEKSGIGFLGVVGNGLKLGALSVAESDTGFVSDVARLLGSEDKQHVMQMYDGLYGVNGRQQYRTHLNAAINMWENSSLESDKEKAEMYKQRLAELDAGGYDIYYAGFSPDQKLLDLLNSTVQKEVASTQAYVDEHATDSEATWVRRVSSATNSAVLNTRSIAFSAATGVPLALSSFGSFFSGSFEDYYQKGQDTFGWDSTTSAKYAFFGALINAASEAAVTSSVYNAAGEGLAKIISDGSLKLVTKFGVNAPLARVGYAALSYIGTALPEVTQELAQNGIEGMYDYVATAIKNGSLDAGTWNTMVDNFTKAAIMDTITSTLMSTGGSWGASQVTNLRNGGINIFSKNSQLQMYALTELHPELREQFDDLLKIAYAREGYGAILDEEKWNPLPAEESGEAETSTPVVQQTGDESLLLDDEEGATILDTEGNPVAAPVQSTDKAPGAPDNSARAVDEAASLPEGERSEALPAGERSAALPEGERSATLPEGDIPEALPAGERSTALPAGQGTTALPAPAQPVDRAPGAPDNSARAVEPETQAESAPVPVEAPAIPDVPTLAGKQSKKNASKTANAISGIGKYDVVEGQAPELDDFKEKFSSWLTGEEQKLKSVLSVIRNTEKSLAALGESTEGNVDEATEAERKRLAGIQSAYTAAYNEIRNNIAKAKAELLNRMLTMNIQLRIRDALRDPETRAAMTQTIADSNTAAALNAGTLTADPDTKAAVEASNEAEQEAQQAELEAQQADLEAQQAGDAVKAARAENKNNPTPENGKLEVAAAKTASTAKAKAEKKRADANTARKKADKAKADATEKLDKKFQNTREKAMADATASMNALGVAVEENSDDALAAGNPENMTLEEAVTPSAEPEVQPVSPEAVQEAAEAVAEPGPADSTPFDERMDRVNPKFSIMRKGTKYDSLKEAYRTNEQIRGIIDGMTDEEFADMLTDIAGKGRGLRASNVPDYIVQNYTPAAESKNSAETSAPESSTVEAVVPESPVVGEATESKPETKKPDLDEIFDELQALGSERQSGTPEAISMLHDLLEGWTKELNDAHDKINELYDAGKINGKVISQMWAARKQEMRALSMAIRRIVHDSSASMAADGYSLSKTTGTAVKLDKLLNDFRSAIKSAEAARKAGDMDTKDRYIAAAMNAGNEFDRRANDIFKDYNEIVYRSGSRKGSTNSEASGPNVDAYTPLLPIGHGNYKRMPKGNGKNKLKTPLEAAQRLAKDLHIGLYHNTANRWNQNAQGEADRERGTSATDPHSGNDMDVLFHEIGHTLQTITGTTTVPKGITDVFPSKADPVECYAEFVKMYIEGYNQAVAYFGQDVVDEFENSLKNGRRKGAFKAVTEARVAMEEFYNADSIDRGIASISHVNHVNDTDKSTEQAVRDKLRQGVIAMADDTYAAARFDSASGLLASQRKLTNPDTATVAPNTTANAPSTRTAGTASTDVRNPQMEERLTVQEQAKLMKADSNRANRLLTKELTTMGGKHISEGFMQAIAIETPDGKRRNMSKSEMQLFEYYSTAKHALDRAQFAEDTAAARLGRPLTADEAEAARRSKQVFNEKNVSIDELRQDVARIEREHPELAACQERMTAWWRDFMQEYGVNSGLMTQDQMDFLNTIYPNYVPTYRDYPNAPAESGGSGGQSLFQLITGSDLNVMSPLEGMAYNVTSIVERGRQNAALRTIYNQINPATNPINSFETGAFVREVPSGESMNRANVLSFTDEKGKQRHLEFKDIELYNLIASNATPKQAGDTARILGKLTRTMSMLTTGSNPLFALKNVVRDFQQGVNHGTWAYTYIDGIAKWMLAGARLGAEQLSQWDAISDTKLGKLLGKVDENLGRAKNRGHAAEYLALQGDDSYTGHGIAMTDKQAKDFMQMFVPGWGEKRTNKQAAAVGKAKDIMSKAWNVLTLNSINGWVEQTTRFAEYLYGEHGNNNLTTDVGRQKAYLAAQESTTNFQLSGNSKLAADLRRVIPFFNATLQGTYSIIHATSEAERGKLGERVIKSVGNNLLTGALAYMLLDKFGSDDDKKWYEKLADGIKFDNIVIPLGGDKARQFLRIPLTQNGFGKFWYAIGNIAMSKPGMNELKGTLGEICGHILNDAIQTDTVLNPFLNVLNNRTHFGSNIVANYLLERSNTMQYNESTAGIFVSLAQAINYATGGKGWKWATNPMMLEYIFQQETGFIGKLLAPVISGNRATGYSQDIESIAWNLWNTFRNDWTIDAAYSNDINDAYHQGMEDLGHVIKDFADVGRSDTLAFGLTEEEQQEAANQANYLMGSTGPFTRIKKTITGLYKVQESIFSDDSLTPDEKLAASRDIQKQIVELEEEGISIYKEYAKTYMNRYYPIESAVYGKIEGKDGISRSAVYGYPVLSKAEGSKDYPGINKLLAQYNSMDNPNATFNPCPATSIKINESESIPVYSLDEDSFNLYQQTYLDTLESAMAGANTAWDSMTLTDKEKTASSAKSSASKAAKAAVINYMINNGLVDEQFVTVNH